VVKFFTDRFIKVMTAKKPTLKVINAYGAIPKGTKAGLE